MIARNRERSLGLLGTTTETVKDVQHRTAMQALQVARSDAHDADVRKVREDRMRMDAIPTEEKCKECGEPLSGGDEIEAGIHPACGTEVARKDMRARNAARSRQPFGLATKMRGGNDPEAA